MKKIGLLVLSWVMLFISCSKDENLAEPGFYKIYDDFDASKKFKTLDIADLGDSGFLILASVNDIYTAIVKIDKAGDFVGGSIEETQFINPIPKIVKVNGEYFFLAMNPSTYAAILVKIENTATFTIQHQFSNISYPLAVNEVDGKDILILNYERAVFRSKLSLTNINGDNLWNGSTAVNQNIEEQIIRHYNGTGKKFPFFVGKLGANSMFYANCFNNYNFSLCLFDKESNLPSTVYNGSGYNGGFSSLYPTGGSNYLATRFLFADNFLIPDFKPALSGIFFGEDVGGGLLNEIAERSPFYFATIKHQQRDIFVIGANSINQNILLYFYDSQSKSITHKEVIGNSSHPMEIGGLTYLSDGGLLVASTVKISGIIHRIALAKLNRNDLSNILSN